MLRVAAAGKFDPSRPNGFSAYMNAAVWDSYRGARRKERRGRLVRPCGAIDAAWLMRYDAGSDADGVAAHDFSERTPSSPAPRRGPRRTTPTPWPASRPRCRVCRPAPAPILLARHASRRRLLARGQARGPVRDRRGARAHLYKERVRQLADGPRSPRSAQFHEDD